MTTPISFDTATSLLNYTFGSTPTNGISSLSTAATDYNLLNSISTQNAEYINQALSAISSSPTYSLSDIQSQVTGPGSAVAMSGQMENTLLLSGLPQSSSAIPGMPTTDNSGLPYNLLNQLPLSGTNIDKYL